MHLLIPNQLQGDVKCRNAVYAYGVDGGQVTHLMGHYYRLHAIRTKTDVMPRLLRWNAA